MLDEYDVVKALVQIDEIVVSEVWWLAEDEEGQDYILTIMGFEKVAEVDDDDELAVTVYDDVGGQEYNGNEHNDEMQDDARLEDDEDEDELEALERLEAVVCDDMDDYE